MVFTSPVLKPTHEHSASCNIGYFYLCISRLALLAAFDILLGRFCILRISTCLQENKGLYPDE